MDVPWKFLRRRLRIGRLGQDELRNITVGDPDPTSPLGQKCGFEWADETSQTLVLLWSCTRELGHQGQHLAGTGEWVAAVRGSEEHQPRLPQTGNLKLDTTVKNLATKDR
jgi:hypothetical protein